MSSTILSFDSIPNLSVSELKKALITRGLTTVGLKSDLVKTLQNAITEETKNMNKNDNRIKKRKTDHELQEIYRGSEYSGSESEDMILEEEEDKSSDTKEFKHVHLGQFSDFVIKYKSTAFHVHKYILFRESAYFRRTLNPEQNEVEIPPIQDKAWGNCIITEVQMNRFLSWLYDSSNKNELKFEIKEKENDPYEFQGPFIALCTYFSAIEFGNFQKSFKNIKVKVEPDEANLLIILRYCDVYESHIARYYIMKHIAATKDFADELLSSSCVFRDNWESLEASTREVILLLVLGLSTATVNRITDEYIMVDSDDDGDEDSK